MGIDYVVDLSCVPKSELSVPTIIVLIKGRNAGLEMLRLARERGDVRPLSALVFGRGRLHPSRLEGETVTVQQTLDAAGRLNPYERYCDACPANVTGESFGCYSSLPYPIPAPVERWLLDRLPSDLSTTAGMILRVVMDKYRFEDGLVQQMHNQALFFARREPQTRTWGQGEHRWSLSSIQLLQLLIGHDTLPGTHCAMLALYLGLVPHTSRWDSAEAIQTVLQQPLIPPPAAGPEIRPWAGFLQAIHTAARLNVPLLVDC